MLDCDISNLAAVAALCITGPQREKILLQRDIQAERLVELFHSLLEVNVELEERYRRCFFNALVMFSKACGYCPRGIYLADDSISNLVLQSQGGFGEVFKGRIGSIDPRLVAVKVLKRGKADWSEYKKELSKEAIVWRHLCHPNCLPLYGVYDMPMTGYTSIALVSPWMNRGTLADYLKQNSKANRTRLILDVVRGLNYLHSMKPHIAHRDIKPQNILITNKGHACLADFGLVSVFDVDEHFRTATNQLAISGTHSYMALELLRAENEDAKRRVNRRACDMYALGCTIYVVYTDNSPRQVHVDLTSNQLPVKISADMWSFVQNLCGKDPSKRLTAEMAVSWMEEKARQEGTDANPAPFAEEWEWRGPSSDRCLWSV